jgi:predicted nucleotidyltransferase
MDPKKRKKLLLVLRKELEHIFGDDLYQILLYGSHARGEERADSDLDILVILHNEVDYAYLIRMTSAMISRLCLENEVVISRAFISRFRYEHERSPFVLNVQQEGIPI